MTTASEDRDWRGAAPKVPGEGDFEEVLRRALRSAAENIEPTADGLTQAMDSRVAGVSRSALILYAIRQPARWLTRRSPVTAVHSGNVSLVWIGFTTAGIGCIWTRA